MKRSSTRAREVSHTGRGGETAYVLCNAGGTRYGSCGVAPRRRKYDLYQ